jgi:hypothetical protein
VFCEGKLDNIVAKVESCPGSSVICVNQEGLGSVLKIYFLFPEKDFNE